MRSRHVAILFAAVVLLFATNAFADPVTDPSARTGGGTGGGSAIPLTNSSNIIVLTSPVFVITTNSNGGGAFMFQNGTQITFNTLSFTAIIVAPKTLTLVCGTINGFPSVFSSCEFIVTPLPGGLDKLQVVFINQSEGGGVPPGATFTLSLNDNGGIGQNNKGGWGANNPVTGMGSPSIVPEPGTMALTLSGLGALLAARKRRRQGAS